MRQRVWYKRFHALDRRLAETETEVNKRVAQSVDDVNRLAEAIAEVNDKIALAQGRGGRPPNDLLDERDGLIRQLSEQIDVSTSLQDDGTLSVFIGNGQTLVLGAEVRQLGVQGSEFDPTRLEVTYSGTSGTTALDTGLTGGTLGGLLEFRSRLLDPARQALGRTAVGLSEQFNQQLAAGADLRGALGGDFFSIADPAVLTSSCNAGSGTASATVADLSAVTGDDYRLGYDGANYTLTDSTTGQAVALAGTGSVADPFVADGLEIVVGGAPAAGDELLIRSTAGAGASINLGVSDPQSIAMSLPTRVRASLNNIGDAAAGSVSVVDATDPNLLASATIEFTSATTYTVNGAGAFAYTDGQPIVVNGTEIVISGAPQTGDQFVIEANASATGDNGNGLLLAGVQAQNTLDGGTLSLGQNYGQLVADVGSSSRQLKANLDAQSVVLESVEAEQLAESGVNLDEEAANLIRFPAGLSSGGSGRQRGQHTVRYADFRNTEVVMRVSTLASYRNGLSALQQLQSALDRTQRQISSGKRLLTPSDDPISAARAIDLREKLSRLQQFDRNTVVARNRLQDEEAALSDVNNVLQRVRELALQANNSTQSNESRSLIATELRQRLDQLVDLANAKDGTGAYLFAGNQADTQPVVRVGSTFTYSGDQGGRAIAIGDSREIEDGHSGDEVFFRVRAGNGTFTVDAAGANAGSGVVGSTSVADATQYDSAPYSIVFLTADSYEVRDAANAVVASAAFAPGDTIAFRGLEIAMDGAPAAGDTFAVAPSPYRSVFESVERLLVAVETPVVDAPTGAVLANGINNGLRDLDGAIGRLLDVQTQIGSRLAAIDTQADNNSAASLNVQDALGALEDLDYAEALSRLSQESITLEAAQKSFVATQRLLLFNFI